MSGDAVLLTDTPAGRIAVLVGVLRRFPATPRWVLVGGLAVNVRLARPHRVTNDVDTVSGDQPKLIELLASSDDAVRLSAAKVELGEPSVEVDVMESTEGAALPAEPGERAFALARRWAMQTASAVSLGVVDANGAITAEADLAVASVPALIALKTVAIPRRRAGSYPEKIGSDIQDLYRLVERAPFGELVVAFSTLEAEARAWVATSLARGFREGSADLRYAAMRMRRFSDNVDSRAIEEDDLALLGELGGALGEP